MNANKPSTPRGWYLAADAAQLIGVSAPTVAQWAQHGYIKATRQGGPPQVFSFQDVAEGLAVHELLKRRVKPADIRQLVANLRGEYGDWPLVVAPLRLTTMSPRRAKVILDRGEHKFDIAFATGHQTVLDLEELLALKSLLTRGGWVVRDHTDIRHVEVDPDKLSGKPSLRGRRIAVQDVAEMVSEEGRDVVEKEYGLHKAEIDDAVKWWQLVSEAATAA